MFSVCGLDGGVGIAFTRYELISFNDSHSKSPMNTFYLRKVGWLFRELCIDMALKNYLMQYND